MEKFINSPLAAVIFVLLVIVLVILAIRFGQIKKVKQVLLRFVLEAEDRYGGGTGEIKFSYVAGEIYKLLPVWLQFLLSAKLIAKLINDTVDYMKEYLTENPKAEALLTK